MKKIIRNKITFWIRFFINEAFKMASEGDFTAV